jgi:hypothetical protein
MKGIHPIPDALDKSHGTAAKDVPDGNLLYTPTEGGNPPSQAWNSNWSKNV